jgi:hypothetical protein
VEAVAAVTEAKLAGMKATAGAWPKKGRRDQEGAWACRSMK